MNVKLTERLYKSPLLKTGFKFASENSALFVAGASCALSCTLRPLCVALTPDTDKKTKKVSIAKSIASSLIDIGFIAAVSLPFAKGLNKIDKNPQKYLNPKTIENLKGSANSLQESKSYQYIAQMFKLGLGFLCAYPKALAANKIIPKIINKDNKEKEEKTNKPSFKGVFTKIISNAMNSEKIQNSAKKLQNTNFKTNMMALKDIFATGTFIHITNRNKNLDKNEKKILNYNAAISTGLCLAGGYILDNALTKPAEKFADKFIKINKLQKEAGKYKEGIALTKTVAAFGLTYYCLIPLISTFLSGKIAKNNNSPQKENHV